jgi:hypothetical protein
MNTANDRLPNRTLPLLYFAAAHVALALASLLVALSPRAVAGFYYHSRMVAIVHLVTLGWITSSILGAIYVVGPATLGIRLPVKRTDYAAFALVLTGIVGMVGHFWIEEYGGMAWAAATATTGVLYVLVRFVRALRESPAPAGVTLHLLLAALNFTLAASAGIALGLDKVFHYLPGFVLANVFAHAHLAAVGWATMMVVGVAYRLLPMVLPAKAPRGKTLFGSAALLEVGVVMLFVALVMQSAWAQAGALLVVGGIACFAWHVVEMLRHRQRRPAAAPAVDFAALHAAGAAVALLIAMTVGIYLLFTQTSELSLRLAIAYGVFGLIGFLGQMVVGMLWRLIALTSWYHQMAAEVEGRLVPPYSMPNRRIQALVFVAWTFAVPSLAAGFALNGIPLVSGGAWALFAAVVLSAAGNAAVALPALPAFRQRWRKPEKTGHIPLSTGVAELNIGEKRSVRLDNR